ncbi:hypothetical protein FOZG_17790 [Fusarium oxysporum Fo47]|uniref:Arrestin-like N-terminal domain-containing protein n=1 Tax=Fusarium oxysporum Fo47 TaxID=660027 RepID=W9JG93_FUSOX|nr:hypothetical protein FOZG_17790 [Fusarium oxysporum Fo47]
MPITLGNGATCSIHLDEPSLFLSGFESLCCYQEQNDTAVLRGTLQLHVSRNTKIKSVQLKLVGRTRLDWQQETQPDFHEECNLPTQVSTFFSALNNHEKNDFGFQCRYQLQSASGSDSNFMDEGNTLAPLDLNLHSIMGAKKRRRLALDNVQAQCYNHGNMIRPGTEVQDYKIFYPGTYDYPFAFSIAQDELETIKVPYGSVKWELRATIARADPHVWYDVEEGGVKAAPQVYLEECRCKALPEGKFDSILPPRLIHADVDEQIILHISRLDANVPAGKKRIYRDTITYLPVALLNCRANQANMSLPSYSDETFSSLSYHKSCGCPDALTIPIEKPPRHSIGGLAACHLVDDGHSAHPTTNSWQPTEVSGDHAFDLSSSDDDIIPPSVPALINDELPPHYDDIVASTCLNGLEHYSPT